MVLHALSAAGVEMPPLQGPAERPIADSAGRGCTGAHRLVAAHADRQVPVARGVGGAAGPRTPTPRPAGCVRDARALATMPEGAAGRRRSA